MNTPTQTEIELREKSSAAHAEAAASFERCDTDGFLSQWANGLTGRLYSTQADIVAAGGVSEFWGLFTLSGERIKAKQIEGKFGPCWAICDEQNKFARFLPFCQAAVDLRAAREFSRYSMDDAENEKLRQADIKRIEKRIATWEKKHNVSQRRELAPAAAKMDGKGYGLSGSAWVSVFRTDGGFPADSLVIK